MSILCLWRCDAPVDFDLEYQVYGEVPGIQTSTGENSPQSLFWMADDRRHAVRIVHRQGAVVGFNLMGVRYRHEICEAWIREQRSVEYVVRNLRRAHFDPEFCRRWDRDITAAMRSML